MNNADDIKRHILSPCNRAMLEAAELCGCSVGFVDQLRVTVKTRNVDGLSLMQWAIFTAASAIFAVYYIHLDQWIMVVISTFGTGCCLMQSAMILRLRRMESGCALQDENTIIE